MQVHTLFCIVHPACSLHASFRRYSSMSFAHALRRADRYLLRDWVKQKAVNSQR